MNSFPRNGQDTPYPHSRGQSKALERLEILTYFRREISLDDLRNDFGGDLVARHRDGVGYVAQGSRVVLSRNLDGVHFPNSNKSLEGKDLSYHGKKEEDEHFFCTRFTGSEEGYYAVSVQVGVLTSCELVEQGGLGFMQQVERKAVNQNGGCVMQFIT